MAQALAASRPHNPGADLALGNDRADPPAGIIGAAERLVADRIRFGRMVLEPELQRVDDVIGVKLIGRDEELARMEARLDELEYTWAFHREVRDGSYVGTHLLVDLELPPIDAILATMDGIDWRFAHGRGLQPSELQSTFRDYVVSGSRTFRVELILTTFEDLVESEFGRCIHEQRILDQRSVASDFDRLATNASWIIEHMLRLAISPTVTVDGLPIKLWGRYVRDTVAHAIDLLDGAKPSEWLVPDEHLEDLLSL